jgi:hypothetical protein
MSCAVTVVKMTISIKMQQVAITPSPSTPWRRSQGFRRVGSLIMPGSRGSIHTTGVVVVVVVVGRKWGEE